jgi:hypothetical protein
MSNDDISGVFEVKIYIDHSGIGNHWQLIERGEIPLDILNEIESEIIDGGIDECQSYIASNGLHYKWKR